MTSLERLIENVDSSIEEIVKLEQDLVRIPSVNTGIMPTGNETEVCNYISKFMENEGIESKLLSRDSARDNFNFFFPNK